MPARSYSYLATNIRSVVWFISAEKQIYKKEFLRSTHIGILMNITQ